MKTEPGIRLCTDIGYQSLHKFGEELCGDNVAIVRPSEDSAIVVLADGLGSGVKASILSTLTCKIIATMMAQNMPLHDCVSAIVATLPICSVRQIAYSTFTIISIKNNQTAEIFQYDSPPVILLRGGKHHELTTTSEIIEGKTIHKAEISLQENDTFIAISDGVEYASDDELLNFGWLRTDIIKFMEGLYQNSYAAKALTTFLLDQCFILYGGQPGDDATVCTVKIRRRQPVNLMIGPPENRADDNKMLSLFFSKAGKHVVCGGTTASIAAGYLGKQLQTGAAPLPGSGIPPTSQLEGVDLVTEGLITLSRVLDYSEDFLGDNKDYLNWYYEDHAASQLSRLLFEEATDIHFFVGKADNPAYKNPEFAFDGVLKLKLVDELAGNLQKMGKQITVSYF